MSPVPAGLLHVTLFFSGAAVMVLEILGTRVLGPVYGVGVQVWAALITVTLAALALGYWVGGALADRRPSPALFFGVVLLAGVATLLVPPLSGPVNAGFAGMGMEAGVLVSALVLFGPGLFLLGMLTPFACRIHPAHASRTGRTVGRLYAVSTIGSVVGALLAGFVLLPLLPVTRIVYLTAVLLGLAAGLGLLLLRRRRGAGIAAVLAIAALVPWRTDIDTGMVDVVRDELTFHHRIQTVDGFGERYLLLNGFVNTHIRLDRPDDPVQCEYQRAVEILPALRPAARRYLLVGCGGGAMLRILEGAGRTIDVVDVDAAVIRAAKEDFGAGVPGAAFFVDDGRRFLRRGGTWDAVVLDINSSEGLPEHLSTVEFFREVKAHLAGGGVMFLNSMGEPGGRALASLRRTIRNVFANLLAFTAHVHEKERSVNVLWIASDGPVELPARLRAVYANRIYPDVGEGVVLTDDYNPLNVWNAALGLRLRRKLHESFGREVFGVR